MKVLVLGGSGMLGHKVHQEMSQRFETYTTFRGPVDAWSQVPFYHDGKNLIGGVDATDFGTVQRAVEDARPDVVINCIGVVKQLKEAHDPVVSITINSLFPHRLAGLCAASGTRLIHISTDCVFSGRKGHYTEEDFPDAEDLYGRSKLLGEVSAPGCLTIRTSVIGRDFSKSTGLLEWFLANRGGKVKGYVKAIYSGFTTQALAKIIANIINDRPDLTGLYHVASQPISKYDLLLKLRAGLQLKILVEPDEGLVCDRSLSANRFVTTTGCRIPTWDEMIQGLATDPIPYDNLTKRHATS